VNIKKIKIIKFTFSIPGVSGTAACKNPTLVFNQFRLYLHGMVMPEKSKQNQTLTVKSNEKSSLLLAWSILAVTSGLLTASNK